MFSAGQTCIQRRWALRGNSLKRRMMRVVTLSLLGGTSLLPLLGQSAFAREDTVAQAANAGKQTMAAEADPSFEVATIRPSDPNHPITEIPIGHRIVFSGATVRFLMAFIYNVHDKQIVGAPAWLGTEQFDIEGVANTPGAPNLPQLKIMLQKLLADRFQLRFHRGTREMAAYVLSVAKDRAKLDPSSEDSSTIGSFLGRPGRGMTGRNLTMVDFARLLQSGILDRPVVDRTSLRGRYDFLLTWTPDESQFTQVGARIPPPTESADAPPGLFTAIQEQLGLRLTAEKTRVEVLAIDSIERPTAN